jgi:hypothetical protein
LNGLSLLEILADYQKQINDLKAKITWK